MLLLPKMDVARMFTGLTECLGTIRRVAVHSGGKDLFIDATFSPRPVVGESIAVNGACLTVAASDGDPLHFQAGPRRCSKQTSISCKPAIASTSSVRCAWAIGSAVISFKGTWMASDTSSSE